MQNDHDLIKQFQNGNQLSFEELVRKHLSSTIGFFFNITGDKMLSEDLSQDVFFKLHKSLKKFRFDASFSTYFYRVKLNTANSWLRTNKWKNLLHLDQIPDEVREDMPETLMQEHIGDQGPGTSGQGTQIGGQGHKADKKPGDINLE